MSLKADFGHMVPNYQIEGRDDEDVSRMLGEACRATGTKLIFLHKKSMKAPQAARIKDLAVSEGLEIVVSSDFDPLDQ